MVNFQDYSNITLNYVFETPVEISTIEFNPENPNWLIGGCISGQVLIWDVAAADTRIKMSKKEEAQAAETVDETKV